MTLIELEAKLSFLEPSKSSSTSTSKEGGGGEEEDLGPVVVITMIKTSSDKQHDKKYRKIVRKYILGFFRAVAVAHLAE